MEQREQRETLSLEELSSEVTDQLNRHGLLDAQSDHRVSAAPDARTIRYYTTLGLLDRPIMAGRQARYSRRHLLQLLAIKALQGANMPLAEIQSRLYGRSDRELEALLASVAGSAERKPAEVKVLRWREVMIEPGLKIMAEESWSPELDQAALIERIRVALTALKAAPNGGADGGWRDEHSGQ